MLIKFEFENYRSFRDKSILSMEAKGNAEYKSCLLPYKKKGVLPAVAIFGKNGGGKSNVIRAFWLGVQFIRNAQKTQHEKAESTEQVNKRAGIHSGYQLYFICTFPVRHLRGNGAGEGRRQTAGRPGTRSADRPSRSPEYRE